MVSQEWTKLQLESKEDLFFVFDGIKGRLEQKLDRVSQAEAGDKWSELKQVFNQKAAGSQDFERLVNEKLTKVFDDVLSMVSANCQVNGVDWKMAADASAPQQIDYAPLDEGLLARLNQVQAETDMKITKVAQLRKSAKENATEELNKIQTLRSKQNDETSMDVNLKTFDAALPCEWDLVYETFAASMAKVPALLKEVSALIARLKRYNSFVEAETLDEKKYNEHMARVGIDSEATVTETLSERQEKKMWNSIQSAWNDATCLPSYIQ